MRSRQIRTWLIALALFGSAQFPLLAQNYGSWSNHNDGRWENINASISGGGGNGKCTFEVTVTGVAEVQIRGGEGRIVSVDGSPATWRRLNCNQPLPASPNDFHFSGVDGHGRQTLVQSPAGTNGVAIVRIDNTTGEKRGRPEGYTGDITWKGGTYSNGTWNNNSYSNGNWSNNSSNWSNGSTASAASQACMSSVTARIQQDHQDVTNLNPLPNTTSESPQSNGQTSVQGEGQYQAANGNVGKFSYRCLYDQSTQQVVQSTYSRE